MKRSSTLLLILTALLGVMPSGSSAAEMKVIQTQKTNDAVVTLKSETGQWSQGKNAFVLELTSPDGKPIDAGKVTLSTSMPMPGMAPMIAGAALTRGAEPGRYLGTISFPDRGARQVTVNWDGPAGNRSTKFSVPVR